MKHMAHDDELNEIISAAFDEPESCFDFPWASDNDERRRLFVFSYMEPNIDALKHIRDMNYVCQWLKTGVVPDPEKDIRTKFKNFDTFKKE